MHSSSFDFLRWCIAQNNGIIFNIFLKIKREAPFPPRGGFLLFFFQFFHVVQKCFNWCTCNLASPTLPPACMHCFFVWITKILEFRRKKMLVFFVTIENLHTSLTHQLYERKALSHLDNELNKFPLYFLNKQAKPTPKRIVLFHPRSRGLKIWIFKYRKHEQNINSSPLPVHLS